jgi:hypothetical protein
VLAAALASVITYRIAYRKGAEYGARYAARIVFSGAFRLEQATHGRPHDRKLATIAARRRKPAA